MRKLLFAVPLLALTLAGCNQATKVADWWAQKTPAEKAVLIATGVSTTCGVSIKVADVTAALTAGDPVATTVDTAVKFICNQFGTSSSTQALTSNGCVAVMNGVCIHKADNSGE